MTTKDRAHQLQNGEKMLFKAGLHPLSLVSPVIWILVVLVAAFMSDGFVSGALQKFNAAVIRPLSPDTLATVYRICMAGVAVVGASVVWGVANAFVAYLTYEIAVTDRRTIATWGLLRRETSTTYLRKVESVHYGNGPIERLLGTGSASLVGTGGEVDYFTRVDDFGRFVKALEAAVAANRNRQ